MCRATTGVIRSAALVALGSALFVQTTPGQTTSAQTAPGWRRIGGTSVAEGLAGGAGGPATDVWFSPAGDRILVRTASGRVFEGDDASAGPEPHWRLSTTEAPSRQTNTADVVSPKPGAIVADAGQKIYAATSSEVFRSEDGGLTWVSVSRWNGRSILGDSFSALAVSPSNPEEVIVANSRGAWRSADGGLSWRSLNDKLPNLPVRKLEGRYKIGLADGVSAELVAGQWTISSDADPETALIRRFSSSVGSEITAAAQASRVSYAGTADGRLLASRDSGATWPDVTRTPNGGPVERFWVDPAQPEVALAIAGGRVLRTVSGGELWDDVSGSLPDGAIHGVAADRLSDRVWIATDRGAFEARVPLNSASIATPEWQSIGRDLPAAAAEDVRLNNDNTLEIALDGYGVFEIERSQPGSVHVANGADMSDRPAAPGSVISVIGAKVTSGTSGGLAWPVLAVSTQSSQLQVPFEVSAGTSTLAIEASGNSFTAQVKVKETSPAVFVDADGAPLLLDAASGLVLDPKSGVRAGSLVEVMATGLGRVNPQWPTGIPAPADAPPAVRGSVTAFLDGAPLEVISATLAPGYVGYYLVELKIPGTAAAGIRELRLVMNGEESNAVKIYIAGSMPAQSMLQN